VALACRGARQCASGLGIWGPGAARPKDGPSAASGTVLEQPRLAVSIGDISHGLFNIIGSLQNLESAEAAGDRYPTRRSLLVNGLCSVAAACFGSAFPTTIYIGHPGWKAMGARSGYSVLNGLAITLLCLVGGVKVVLQVVPLEAALGILLWIGLIMTAQAFQSVPKSHALAVGLGLVPALASWALVLIQTALRAAGSSLYVAAPKFGSDLYIHGVIALSQGFMLSSMVLSALLVHVIEHNFLRAAVWAGIAAVLSLTGLIHAYELTLGGVQNLFGWAAAPVFCGRLHAWSILLDRHSFPASDVNKTDRTSLTTQAASPLLGLQ